MRERYRPAYILNLLAKSRAAQQYELLKRLFKEDLRRHCAMHKRAGILALCNRKAG